MSTDTESQNERLTGRVKWFNSKAGYGFITVCTGEKAGSDIFVHYTSIRVDNTQYKYLVQGEYVEFCLVKTENETHEFHAVDISGIMGGMIMCETQRQNPVRPVTVRPRRVYVSRDDNDAQEAPRTRTRQRDESGDAEPERERPRKAAPRRDGPSVDEGGYVRVTRGKPKSSASR